jgi:beta-galactosidase
VELTDDKGLGIKFSVNQPFNFNVYPFTTENLTKAKYTYELQEGKGLTFNLDYSTSGVGCTARSIFPSYKTPVVRYDREIIMMPIGNDR